MKKILFPLLLLVAFAACKKDSSNQNSSVTQLPAPTHDGRRVVAWKLDGKVYIAEGYTGLFGDWAANGFLVYASPPATGILSLYVRGSYIADQGNTINRLEVTFECPFNHEINQPLTFWEYPFEGLVSDTRNGGSNIPNGGNLFLTDSLHRGTVTVTYADSTSISGTFQMDVVNDKGKVLHITDGMFDVPKYH